MRSFGALLLLTAALALAGCGGGKKAETTVPASTAPGPTTVKVVVKGGKPVGGIVRATVAKGGTVALVVHSDVADEVHLHGYDLHTDVPAGGTARITFKADIPGVFEAELEHRGLQILELTVT